MKTKKGFVLRELGKEYILCPEGVDLLEFSNMFSMNETAAFIWRHMEGVEFTVKDLVDSLLEEYELTEEQAVTDISAMLDMFLKLGVVEN